MRILMKSMMLVSALAVCGAQRAQAETPAVSFDLNPAVRSCLMDLNNCIASIPILNMFFDRGNSGPVVTNKQVCDRYRENWCSDWNNQDSQSGFTRCREAKMAMYEEKARAAGEWPYAHLEGKKGSFWFNIHYMEQVIETHLTKSGQRRYFDCSVKQQVMFIKSVCGDLISEQWPHYDQIQQRPRLFSQDQRYAEDNLCGHPKKI